MGLIKAAMSSVSGVFADQWKEFFTCDSLDKDTLVVRGRKNTSGKTNNNGDDNVITSGSGIVVADGQCMIVVEQGQVVEVCAEPGQYTFDTKLSPSIFRGDLAESIGDSFKEILGRFTYAGGTGRDQRVYYINTKEIMDNKIGTPSPVPFRVIDANIGLDMDISLRMNGVYSYKITNPMLFFTNVCGNVGREFARAELDQQLKSELLAALQPAFAKISAIGVRYSQIPAHTLELEEALREVLVGKWTDKRGLTLQTFNVNAVNADPDDEATIKQLQRNAVMRDPNMAAATLVGAQAQAMQDAAKNSAGAMTGFMGMGMAQNAGGVNAANLFAMGQQQAPKAAGWTCSCGATNTGKFCSNCGKPQPAAGWTCSCGTTNTGKFCSNCGKPQPAGEWTCSCGTVNTGNFCNNCGNKRP